MIFASCRTASAAIAHTSPTISIKAVPEGKSGCSFTAASVVRYITAMPKPCKIRPYSRRRRCKNQPDTAAAKPEPITPR